MHKIMTLGTRAKRTNFVYTGSVKEGATILFSGNPFISPELFEVIMLSFSGQTINGGFSMTDPIHGGLGQWIQDNSQKYGRKLTPRHGSFIAAILVNEGYVRNSLKGNTIRLHFPEYPVSS